MRDRPNGTLANVIKASRPTRFDGGHVRRTQEKKPNVNCVLPTIIDTPENRSSMPDADPTRRVMPAALADVIVFLCSANARAIHGASSPVTRLV